MHLSERLENYQLEGGWTVLEKVILEEGMTGSNFSIGYTARRDDGGQGFVKVLNISRASLAPDPARALQELTTAFNFERDIVADCKRMSRVITALAEGTVREQPSNGLPEVAQYIVFERADSDLRKSRLLSKTFDLALNLRALHHVATGLSQLHSKDIAHQDLKPSNVLLFENTGSKIGDLGHSSRRQVSSPHDNKAIAADPAYSPPEFLYGFQHPSWDVRRRACDLFQLGSLLVYMFTGVGMTRLLLDHMPDGHRPPNWSGSYNDMLPYMSEHFRLTMENISTRFPKDMRDELCGAVMQLCTPDPLSRGHPINRAIHAPFGLERYISLFNMLAIRAEISLRRSLK